MEILSLIQSRRSIRKYKAKPVEDEKIKIMLESARLAPSGGNTQPWNFIIVRSDKKKEQLVKASHNQKWMLQAPVFIVCVADARMRLKNQNEIVFDEDSPESELKKIIRDTTISVEHLVLQAVSIGFSTCWVAYFKQKDIRPLLNIPSDKYVISIVVVGYGDENPPPRPRKPLKEMVHFETWGNLGSFD